MTEEKRRDKRKDEENRVTITVFSKSNSTDITENIFALTKDISMGGMKIQTDTGLQVNMLLKIELALARSHKLVSVIGKVKWIRQLYDDDVFEAGVEFVDTPPDRVLSILEHLYGQQIEPGKKK